MAILHFVDMKSLLSFIEILIKGINEHFGHLNSLVLIMFLEIELIESIIFY